MIEQTFKRGEIVIVLGDSFKYGFMPAVIVRQSGYKSYQVKIYGNKNDTFVNEYNIQKFTVQYFKSLQQGVQKNNKKLNKLLKKAEKDHYQFQAKSCQNFEAENLEWLYLKQEEMEDNELDVQIDGHCFRNRVEAVKKTKVKSLIQDYYQRNNKTILKYRSISGSLQQTQEQTKNILILKLKFVLDQLILDIDKDKNQVICQQIISSNVIELLQYVISPVMSKMNQYIRDKYKKSCKNQFVKFLYNHNELVLANLQSYFDNYAVFKDANEQFIGLVNN